MSNNKNITDLNELDERALVFLFERTAYIEDMLVELEKIHHIPVQLINNLGNYINYLRIIRTYTEYISVLYRSLFEKAEWIKGYNWKPIDPQAFFTPTEWVNWKDEHYKIINKVDKDIAHQDANTDTRHRYPDIKDESGRVLKVIGNFNQNLLGLELLEKIRIIKEKINKEYKSKHGHGVLML